MVREGQAIVVHIVDLGRANAEATDLSLLRSLFGLTAGDAGLAAAFA